MLIKTGVPSLAEIKSCFPNESLLLKPKAIIECYQEIPCNPCSTSCPFGAITMGDDINQKPQLNWDKCTGCGICVYSCPGLAISVVKVEGNNAIFKIPYEFLPIPKKDEIWDGLSRSGECITSAKIKAVQTSDKQDKTTLVTVEIDKSTLYDFITIRCPYER